MSTAARSGGTPVLFGWARAFIRTNVAPPFALRQFARRGSRRPCAITCPNSPGGSHMSTIESVLQETRVFPPPAELQKTANIAGLAAYQAMVAEAENDLEGFWAKHARKELVWTKPFTKVLDESNAPFFKWFHDGELNASYNCLDRHLKTQPGKVAIIFEADDGTVTTITYQALHQEVCRFANALKSLGLRTRSEEHTSELQSHGNLVCRLLLEKKNRARRRPAPRPRTSSPRSSRAASDAALTYLRQHAHTRPRRDTGHRRSRRSAPARRRPARR